MGAISRFVEKLLQPLSVAVSALWGLSSIRYSYDVLRGENDGYFFRY